MKKFLFLAFSFCGILTHAQVRYTSEIFTSVDVTTETYATNIDFLTSKTNDPAQVGADITEIKTALATGNPIPPKFFDPTDASTDLKVTNLEMDVYQPNGDAETSRPLVIYLHTGNFLPPGLNGGINGSRKDSSVIVMCERLAKRGFVAIAPNYRLGWRPDGATRIQRRGTLLNAVYRAIHDTKELVRKVKENYAQYGIDTTKITLFGEGSGGYAALAYATLDKWAEVEINKFINPNTNESYVDSNLVGNIEGLGGTLNLYANTTNNTTDIAMCVNMGGALADLSWLEAGDPAMIAFHCVRDPFAPFDAGTVIVPTTQEDVVDVVGANVFMEKVNSLGNNSSYTSQTYNDPITLKARSRYGVRYNYIFPAPFDTLSVNTNVEGLFPVIRPLFTGANIYRNNGSPWQWWDPQGPIASSTVPGSNPAITYHQQGLASNPNMSPTFGRTYQDTILNYAVPRMVNTLNLISTKEYKLENSLSFYPNPVKDELYLEISDSKVELERIELTDLSGKLVYSMPLEPKQFAVDLSAVKTGVYFARIVSNEGESVVKLLKE